MWIMLIKKLSVAGSPPKLSIHWSIDGADANTVRTQFDRFFSFLSLSRSMIARGTLSVREKTQDFYWNEDGREYSSFEIGKKVIEFMRLQKDTLSLDDGDIYEEDNWAKARWIEYNGKNIRVFAREYQVMEKENMYLYIGLKGDDDTSHDLIPTGAIGRKQAFDLEDSSLKDIYDAAVVDGATHEQATAMALGLDVTNLGELSDIPVSGWYKIRDEYGLVFCTEDELAV